MNTTEGMRRLHWDDLPGEPVDEGITCQRLDTQRMTLLRYRYQPGARFPAHAYPQEQIVLVMSGQIEFTVADRTVRAAAGSVLVIPPSVVHSARVLGEQLVDTINVLSPRRTSEITLASDEHCHPQHRC